MKHILTTLILLISELAAAQSDFPDFLQGTWKMENQDVFEHWDKLNDSSYKGISYVLKDGQINISEYLDIIQINKEIAYIATVVNQNQGRGIIFKRNTIDSAFTFENPNHDFPKRIMYKKLNDSEFYVLVSDYNEKGFSYKMQKQLQTTPCSDTTIANPNFNFVLAKKLGGDDYGMKRYVLVILKTGTNKTTDKVFTNNSFRGHMENINRLVKKGKMTVAGPLGKNDKTYRGIFILNVTTFTEAEELLKEDTAIKEGLLDYELYDWYGSAALPEYLPFSDKIWKVSP